MLIKEKQNKTRKKLKLGKHSIICTRKKHGAHDEEQRAGTALERSVESVASEEQVAT